MSKKKKLLFVVPIAFHNNVGQAGHKTVNYYLSRFKEDFDVTVLSSIDTWAEEFKSMQKDHPEVEFVGNNHRKNVLQKVYARILFKIIYAFCKKISPFYYTSNGFLRRRLQRLLAEIPNPHEFEYVIVEFTSMILYVDLIKRFFANSKLIASCHDVTFLAVERWLKNHRVIISPVKYAQKFKTIEIQALKKFDLVVTQNTKDIQLLRQKGGLTTNLLHVINPYYDVYQFVPNEPDGFLFFGAMKRQENIDSVCWFLEHVWGNMPNENVDGIKFYVVGGGVSDDLRRVAEKYKNVVLTGFVADPTPFFNKSFAMVVPLIYGGGIKVKSIEALGAGMPLISNRIGIEGIPAKDGEEYVHCESPDEWIAALCRLIEDKDERTLLSVMGKRFASREYNLEMSYDAYKSSILNL